METPISLSDFNDAAQWRALDQEMESKRPCGTFEDARVSLTGVPAKLDVSSASARFTPATGSPCGAGFDLRTFDTGTGDRQLLDFRGRPNAFTSIGAISP